MTIKTPIAIVAYNRPKVLKKTLNAIKDVRFPKVYAICDGPKNARDKKNVQKVRDIIAENFKDTHLVKIYAQNNLGLRKRVVSGLNKVFEKENRIIVLEDDCTPDISFFKYCDLLLEKYKNNKKILSISGDKFSSIDTKNSYMFSKYFHSWGWATWKRAWKLYDDEISDWPKKKQSGWIKKIFNSKSSQFYWKKIFDQIYEEKINSWAYRWSYAHFKHSGVSIIPSVNLVKNIGIGKKGTNTKIKSKSTSLSVESMKFPLIHPKKIKINKKSDDIVESRIYSNSRNIIIQAVRSMLRT